jgi:hypothetical protein
MVIKAGVGMVKLLVHGWMDECPELFKQKTCQVIKMLVLQ